MCLVLRTFFIVNNVSIKDDPVTVREYLKKYIEYCRPLFFYSILGSFILYIDRWLLQKFGGRTEQAFFSVSRQFARISAIATASLMKIYWKEIAEAIKRKNFVRAKNIYIIVSKNLFLLSACISVFLFPYSKNILVLCYGKAYSTAAIPFSIMLFYPVHQTLGQIFGGFFFATEKNVTIYKSGNIHNDIWIISIFFSYCT